jgi:hypothetical protein
MLRRGQAVPRPVPSFDPLPRLCGKGDVLFSFIASDYFFLFGIILEA